MKILPLSILAYNRFKRTNVELSAESKGHNIVNRIGNTITPADLLNLATFKYYLPFLSFPDQIPSKLLNNPNATVFYNWLEEYFKSPHANPSVDLSLLLNKEEVPKNPRLFMVHSLHVAIMHNNIAMVENVKATYTRLYPTESIFDTPIFTGAITIQPDENYHHYSSLLYAVRGNHFEIFTALLNSPEIQRESLKNTLEILRHYNLGDITIRNAVHLRLQELNPQNVAQEQQELMEEFNDDMDFQAMEELNINNEENPGPPANNVTTLNL
jgi:hypothetical protein